MSFSRAACLACLIPQLVAAEAARADRGARDSPGGGPVLARFLDRDEAPLAAYRARRILRAENERFDARAELEVMTELRPDGTFAYEVVREKGSGYIRNKVLRKVLRDEADLRGRRGTDRGKLTGANYRFAEDRSASAADERRVLITPKRKDVLLVDGAIVLSGDGDLLRIEGRLAKNPSFWTRRVDVIRTYARVGGVRVPVSTESVADVRFAGRSRFEMIYRYESVNGRPIAHEPAPAAAVWRGPLLDSSEGVPDSIFEHVTVP